MTRTPRYVITEAPDGKERVSCTRGCGTVAIIPKVYGLNSGAYRQGAARRHEREHHNGRDGK